MKLIRRLKKLLPSHKLRKVASPGVGRVAASGGSQLPGPATPSGVVYLHADRADVHPSAFRGAFDVLNATDGLAGWAVDLRAHAEPLALELVADGLVIGHTKTEASRNGLGPSDDAAPGFRFPPATLLPLLDYEPGKRPGFVGVRVAGGDAYLRPAAGLSTEDVFAAAEAYAATAPDAVFLDPLDFSLYLQERARRAIALLARPVPVPTEPDGFVEVVSALSSDTLMILGWLRRRQPLDVSAVIVAGRRYPAGLSGITFKRTDLQPPSIGFVVFARTDWRPSPDAAIRIQWEDSAPRLLQGNALRILSPTDAGQWIASLDGKAASLAYGEFQRCLSRLDTWVPSEAGLKEAGISYGIDAVLVVPGFGSLAAGWIVSPYKRLRQMALRLGSNVSVGDRGSFSLTPRPGATAGEEPPDKQGGLTFRCMLRGSVREGDLNQPMLRLYFEDGSSYAVAVPRQAIRLCGGPDELARIARLFPGLASDPSLDAFAEAFADTARRQAHAIVPIRVEPAPHVALFTMPRDRDDLRLVLAEIRRGGALLPPGVGIALLVGRHAARDRIVEGAEQIRAATGRPVSVLAIAEPAYSLWSLDAVLAALEAERFWFCGPETVPTALGWRAAAALLRDGGGLTILRRSRDSGAAPEPESLSLAWTAADFRAWAASAPLFLAGFHRDNLLPADPAPTRVDGAISLVRSMIGPEPLRQADERLYRQARAQGNARAEAGSPSLLAHSAVAAPWP